MDLAAWMAEVIRMRTMVSAGACFLFLLAAGCGDGDGSSGSGGTGGTGGAGGAGATGGSGGTGGSATTGGTGGAATTGGTGGIVATTAGSGGSGGAAGAAFGEPCAMTTDCADGLLCYDFNAKGMLCTKMCASAADCPAPSSGCNGMGYCKPD